MIKILYDHPAGTNHDFFLNNYYIRKSLLIRNIKLKQRIYIILQKFTALIVTFQSGQITNIHDAANETSPFASFLC